MALALLLAISLAARATTQAIQDSRCYLMNGGAVESFFVSEDMPIGSVIGTLSVNGDPSDDGNISLTLQEKNAPVGIAPGTKNVTLLRDLDREEKKGPSNVYVNVRCDRRRTTDPSFIIPVSVRVWDVNDNAPVWVGAPYRVRLSELTAVGSRILHNIRATDADQPGPHATIHYSVLPGPHSEYFGFANELDSVLVVKKPLDYETLSNFTVTLRASDQGSPPLHNDTILRVDVLDADDQNPKFSHDHYTATIPDNAEEGTILETSPGPIVAQDQDIGINAPLHYSVSGDKRDLILIDKDTGRVAVTRRLLDATDLPVTVVIKATQVDNPDRYALATLWVGAQSAALSRPRALPVRFTRRGYSAAVREDATPGSVLTVLYTEPPRGPDSSPLQFYVSERSFLEKFAINSAGELLLRKPLDYETKDFYSYQVMVTDGITNDTASLNISVLNVNEWEPRFKHAQYEFRVDGDDGAGPNSGASSGLLPVGTLQVHDGDSPDSITLTLRGAHANMFYINSSGEMFLRADALPTLNTSVLHVVATAIDSGAPPRQTSVPVLVHIGDRLMSPRTAGGAARGGVLLGFACALALLALLVCALLAYIYRNKRRSKVSSPSPPAMTKSSSLAHDKPRSPPTPTNGGHSGTLPNPGALASSGSLLSVSAGASTILANSSSSLDLRGDTLPTNGNGNGTRSATTTRQSTRFPTKSKVAPLPPTLGLPVTDPPPGSANVALMSDHLRQHSTGRSGVAWPSHTIPARVKKLSWDDGENEAHGDGQRGGAGCARRHQPRGARPHESHRLLLTPHQPHHPHPQQPHFYHPHVTYHPHHHPHIQLSYLPPQSVFDPSHLRIVHPHQKTKKCKKNKNKANKFQQHSYLTNPHHPLVRHPQAINHALLHNLSNAVLPSNHPEAINDVLVNSQQNFANTAQIDQVNRNYAQPNMVGTETNAVNLRPDVLDPNSNKRQNISHPVQNVTLSRPHPQNINQAQPSASHMNQDQNTSHLFQRHPNELHNSVPNHSESRLPYSFVPTTLRTRPKLKLFEHPSPNLLGIPYHDPQLRNIHFSNPQYSVPQLSDFLLRDLQLRNMLSSDPQAHQISHHDPQSKGVPFPNPQLHRISLSDPQSHNMPLPNPQLHRLPHPDAQSHNNILPNPELHKIPHSDPMSHKIPTPNSQLDATSDPKNPQLQEASAPRLSQVDPIAALLRKGKGPPPDYATIDPRKLRFRSWRPSFLRRSELDILHRTGSTRGHSKDSANTKTTAKR